MALISARLLTLAALSILIVAFMTVKSTWDFGSYESVLPAHWITHRGIRYIEILSPFDGILEIKPDDPEVFASHPVIPIAGKEAMLRTPPCRVHRISLHRFLELGVVDPKLFVLAPGGEQWRVGWEALLEPEVNRVLEQFLSRLAGERPDRAGTIPDPDEVRIVTLYLSSSHRNPELLAAFRALAERDLPADREGVRPRSLIPGKSPTDS